jgi:phosphate transport system permease protein
VEGDILAGGSSTVYPLTVAMAEGFQAAGFSGVIDVQSTGTTAGLADLCNKRGSTIDIANASRQAQRQEAQLCSKNKAKLVPFEVGLDGIAVIVSAENTFLTNATTPELQQIFLGATSYWSEVNPDWPNELIERYLPSVTSGTLDYFASAVFDQQLHELPAADLIAILNYSLSAGAVNTIAKEKPLDQRSQEELHALVLERVVQPKIVASWNLVDSVFQREEIEATVAENYPDAELEFYAWLNRSLLTNTQSSTPEQSGIRTALLGTLWVVLVSFLFAVPLGIGAAIYLEEYTGRSRLNRIIQTNIDNLAGVPSIIYGILGLAVFVRFFVQVTSGSAVGLSDPATASGRTILSAGLTLGLLILPLVIISSQEAIRSVPQSLREAAHGLGGTKWQVIWSHVLPVALPGILTGTILAVSRAAGETAPLIVVGASTFITTDPTGPFAKFTVVPMQIFQWTSRPQAEFKHLAAAASIVLMILVFVLNGAAIYMRNRFSKRL